MLIHAYWSTDATYSSVRVLSDWGCWGQATFSLIGSVRGLWV
jgi:hypothetical protein